VQYLTGVVGESGKMDTIFLARNRLCGFAFLDIEDLNGLVVTSSDYIVTLVIEVERGGIVRRGLRL
jgi:hypothetical protein